MSKKTRKTAKEIVNGIISDLTDRGGLSDEWDNIDDDTKEEIRADWERIAEEVIAEGGLDKGES